MRKICDSSKTLADGVVDPPGRREVGAERLLEDHPRGRLDDADGLSCWQIGPKSLGVTAR